MTRVGIQSNSAVVLDHIQQCIPVVSRPDYLVHLVISHKLFNKKLAIFNNNNLILKKEKEKGGKFVLFGSKNMWC